MRDRNEIIKTQARRAATPQDPAVQLTTFEAWGKQLVDLSSRVNHSSAMIHALVNHPKF